MENVPKLSEMEKKDIPGYIWDYYKWPIIIVIAVVIALVSIVHGRLTAKDETLYILAGNADSLHMVEHPEGTLDEFLQEQGLDPEKNEIGINTNVTYTGADSQVYTLATLATLIGAGQVDVAISHGELYEYMSGNGEFLPMEEVFTPEEMERYKDHLVQGTYHEITYNEDGTEGETVDHDYICGVSVSADNAWVQATGMYPDTDVVVGVIANTKHKDLAKAFLIYLLENE